MSNDKAAATAHPQRAQKIFNTGHTVLVELPEGRLVGEVRDRSDFVGSSPRRYLVYFPETENTPAPFERWVFAAQVSELPRITDYGVLRRSLFDKVCQAPSAEEGAKMVDQFKEQYPQYAAWADRYADQIRNGVFATGGQIKAKLVDNPYQHAVDPRDVPPAVAAEARIPSYAEADIRLTNEMADRLFAELYPQPAPKRSKMLTPGEIGLACGIVVTIIVLFLFVAFSYPGW